MTVKVGLCGFSMGAETYYELFPVVEVQHTFYEPPPIPTLERWRAQAPPGFEFTIKAWQPITHAGTSSTYRKMKSPLTPQQKAQCGGFRVNATTMWAWERTLASACVLRATAVLFQCPASFRPTDANVSNLRAFMARIGRHEGLRYLWEPRGPAWPDDLLRALCEELQLTHVVDPFVRAQVTASPVYWRLHGIGNAYRAYTDEELATLVKRLPPGADAWVMFNNIPRPKDARRFLSRLSASGAGSRGPARRST